MILSPLGQKLVSFPPPPPSNIEQFPPVLSLPNCTTGPAMATHSLIEEECLEGPWWARPCSGHWLQMKKTRSFAQRVHCQGGMEGGATEANRWL